MEEAFHQYFKKVSLACLGAILVFVGFTVWVDIFGVFGISKNVRVYGEERISKYLMAFRYIPEHFNGIILGPSLSANVDPTPLKDFNFFNASLMGARVQTMIPLLEQVLSDDHEMQRALVCLHPYMTLSNEAVNNKLLTPNSFWSAFGSIHLLRVYGFQFIRWANLAPYKFPQNQYLANGTNKFEPLFRVPDLSSKISKENRLIKDNDFIISPVSMHALGRLLDLLESNQIRTTVYFHPVPLPIYRMHQNKFHKYWDTILRSFSKADSKITFQNFNQSNFEFFTGDTLNYIDHGHLSIKGQKLLLKHIIRY